MARATLNPGSSPGQTTGATPGVSDKAHFPPDPLPYPKLDIVGDGDDCYCAGNAMLAEMTHGRSEAWQVAGEIDEAAKEALDKAATAREMEQLAEASGPSQDLGKVAVKLAYALRLGWWAMNGNGPYADASLAFMGTALSDVILLREAEAQRRYRLGERES